MTCLRVATWDNGGAPAGVGSTTRGRTHSSDLGREGLAMQATRTCSLPDCDRRHKGHGLCELIHAVVEALGGAA